MLKYEIGDFVWCYAMAMDSYAAITNAHFLSGDEGVHKDAKLRRFVVAGKLKVEPQHSRFDYILGSSEAGMYHESFGKFIPPTELSEHWGLFMEIHPKTMRFAGCDEKRIRRKECSICQIG